MLFPEKSFFSQTFQIFPKGLVLFEKLLILDRQLTPEDKILERVLVEYAVAGKGITVASKIASELSGPETIESCSATLKTANANSVRQKNFVGQGT